MDFSKDWISKLLKTLEVGLYKIFLNEAADEN
jgi:hypothetical protein